MGFFSWMTQDTNKSIANHSSGEPVFTVYLMDDKGNTWQEDNYEGYGEFDGKDYYELLDEMNGGSGDRSDGIMLEHGVSTIRNVHTGEVWDNKPPYFHWSKDILRDNMSANELIATGDWEQYSVKPLEVRYPNLVEDPEWVWRNDQPESCEFQGFFYEAESDDKSFAAAHGSHEAGWKLVGKYRRMCRAAPRGKNRWDNVSARMAAGFTLSEIHKLQQFIRKKATEVGGYAGDSWWDSITSVIVDGGATKFAALKKAWDGATDEDNSFEEGENWMEKQKSIDYEENYLYPMHPFDLDDSELHDDVLKSMKRQKLGSIKDPKIRKAWGVSVTKNAESHDYCDECGEVHDDTEGCSWQRCLDCDTEIGEKRQGCQSHYEICAVCCDCCCNVCGSYLQSTPGANQYNWCMCESLPSNSDSKNAQGQSMTECSTMDAETTCYKCGHSIFTECVGCSNDICDECLQPQHLTTASGGEAFESRVGWMCCPECYDENVDVEYTVRKDAEIRTFDAPKAINRTTGKTWIQMRDMGEMALINLMDRTHPSWGVKKGLLKATTRKKFADAMAKSATGWVNASIIKETVDEYLWEDPLKSGPNKGKVKIWNQGKYVYVPHTKAAITKVFKQILVAENKWCKDKAKLKGLNTYAWRTWSPYFWRFHRGGGSSDIFTAMGIAGWDKHTFIDLTRAMMAMDLVEQGKTEEDAWGFDKSPAKAKATMKAYGMTPPANIGKAPSKPKAKAKSSGSKTSKRKGMARRKAKPKSRSSDVTKRKGPNTSATSFNLGTRKKGNDGTMWTVKRSGKSKRWVRGAEEAGDGRSVVQWEDAQGLSSPSGQPSNIKWAETAWDDDDVDLSLAHPVKDGAYVAIGLGIGTLVLAAGLTALDILLTRLRD